MRKSTRGREAVRYKQKNERARGKANNKGENGITKCPAKGLPAHAEKGNSPEFFSICSCAFAEKELQELF